MKYFISAGEASGDIHAAALIRSLTEKDPEAELVFLGGDLMAGAAGHKPLIHYRQMAFMGFSEVLRNLRTVLGNLRTAKQALRDSRPDALVLVDYPSFNLKLAAEACRLNIPVYYYISPKVWAWKEGRVKKLKRYCRRILSILPFEVAFYRDRHQTAIDYVGNPSVGETDCKLSQLPPREEFMTANGLPLSRPVLALVPGSRRGEIRNNLPIMAEVARRHTELQPVIAAAPGIDAQLYESITDITRVEGQTFALLAHADAALVTSGTATLETALIGTPQVVCYRANGSRLSYSLFKRILKIPFVSLPNLIAGRETVPEMLLHHCNPDAIDRRLTPLLTDTPQRRQMLAGYADVRRQLTDADAAGNAAAIILKDLKTSKPSDGSYL